MFCWHFSWSKGKNIWKCWEWGTHTSGGAWNTINAQGMISAQSKGNVIVSVTYFTHFRPKWLLRMLRSWRNRAGPVVMDHSHAWSSLLSAGAVAGPHLGTANPVHMGRGYLQPGLLLLTLAALQSPPPVQNGFFQGQSFKDIYTKIIYKSWKISRLSTQKHQTRLLNIKSFYIQPNCLRPKV